MERRQENLLTQLETEGMEIARCRKKISDLKHSKGAINYSQLQDIHTRLNKHISSFDKISQQLIELEAVI